MRKIIDKFIKDKDYLKNEEVLGIMFYGSSLYKTDNHDSDIDLLIVTSNDRDYRGVTYVDGKRIEYFEKSFLSLQMGFEDLDYSLNRSLISIFKNGEIIFSRDGGLEYLVDEVSSINVRRKVKGKPDGSRVLEFRDLMDSSCSLCFKKFCYYNLLEEYRKYYHEGNGYSDLSSLKVYDVYSNKDYYEKYYCLQLPSQEFRNKFCGFIDNIDFIGLSDLVKNLRRKSKREYSFLRKRKEEVVSASVVLEQLVSRCLIYEKNNSNNFENAYYLVLERIRCFYCRRYGIDSSISRFEEMDLEFLDLFNKCIKEVSGSNLVSLFSFVTKDINIDYRDYKVLDLK